MPFMVIEYHTNCECFLISKAWKLDICDLKDYCHKQTIRVKFQIGVKWSVQNIKKTCGWCLLSTWESQDTLKMVVVFAAKYFKGWRYLQQTISKRIRAKLTKETCIIQHQG